MTVISILLPTRGRVNLVRDLFNSIVSTTALIKDIEVVLYMDEDDDESHSLAGEGGGLKITGIIRPPARAMGQIMGECFMASSGRYIMLMNDDCVFRTRGWDLKVDEAFSFFPDDIAFVYGNDMDQGADVPTFPLLTRRVCEIMGGVCPVDYLNLHIESHLFDIFRHLRRLGHNRVVYLDDVIFEHLHPAVGKSNADETYIKKDTGFDDRLFISLADERLYIAGKLAASIEGKKREPHTETDEAGAAHLSSSTRPLPAVSVIITDFDKKIASRGDSFNAVISGNDGPSFEVIVGDCEPTSGRLSTPGRERVRIVNVKEGTTTSEFCNRASVEARGDYLVFISSGIVPRKGWMEALFKTFSEDRDVAIAGCRIIEPKSGRIRHAGIGFYEEEGAPKYTFIYRGLMADHPAVLRAREFQAVGGGCIMVRKAFFFKAGGFDAEICGLEEIGLCLKVRELGGKVVYTPQAVVCDHAVAKKPHPPMAVWKDRIKIDLFSLLGEDNLSVRMPSG